MARKRLKDIITKIIIEKVTKDKDKWCIDYGEPLVGLVSVDDPRLGRLREDTCNKDHFVPEDLLEGAKTVIVYFLPFPKGLASENKPGKPITRDWAVAYKEANIFLAEIGEELIKELGKMGIAGAGVKPTHNFDEKTLVANWSHRSLAYLASLGKFGLNRMLITEKGCSGRYSSIVIDAQVDIEPKISGEHPCLYIRNGSCQVCVKNCPSGALTIDGFDRHKCYAYMLEHCRRPFEDIKVIDVCGKCLSTPCSNL